MRCVICKKEIEEKFDRWVMLTDFNKGRIVGDCHYHLECWKDRFNISNSEKKKEMYAKTFKSLKNIVEKLSGRFSDGGVPIEV